MRGFRAFTLGGKLRELFLLREQEIAVQKLCVQVIPLRYRLRQEANSLLKPCHLLGEQLYLREMFRLRLANAK